MLVTGRTADGFAALGIVDGAVHLEQLSVHPAAMRQGRGAALLVATVDTAREVGVERVTLITYADIPWNGRWYARHGGRETVAGSPGPQALRAQERAAGLDRHGRRVVLVLDVHRP